MKVDLLVALGVAAASKLIADEVKEWLAWLPGQLIKWAAKQFPEDEGARLQEEWMAHLNDLPGNVGRLCHASGCVFTGARLTSVGRETARQSLSWLIGRFILALIFFNRHFSPPFRELIRCSGNMELYGDIVRARTLRKLAGGLCVLGINEVAWESLGYRPASNRPYDWFPRIQSLTMDIAFIRANLKRRFDLDFFRKL